MIANYRTEEPGARESRHKLRLARRAVAAALLRHVKPVEAPRVPAWKAYILAGWMVLASVWYLVAMFLSRR